MLLVGFPELNNPMDRSASVTLSYDSLIAAGRVSIGITTYGWNENNKYFKASLFPEIWDGKTGKIELGKEEEIRVQWDERIRSACHL